jgi:two-component system, cell cycle response regulator
VKGIESILLVDDDPSLLRMMEEGLSMQGYQCLTATSAPKGYDLFLHNQFDLVITDISMQETDGLEFTRMLKRAKPGVSVIIMTGFIENYAYKQAIDAGADDFIRKPFTVNEIFARISHVERQDRIRDLSIRDQLTGVYNRRGLFTLIDHHFKLSRRMKRGFYLMFADLDELKRINDKWGHQKGDEALRRVAEILLKNYRNSDIVARVGGDEFVVVPVGADGDLTESIFNRLDGAVAESNESGDFGYTLSVSAGAGFYDPEDPCTLEELLVRADTSMYQRKMKKRSS